jgi:hypothetical protein
MCVPVPRRAPARSEVISAVGGFLALTAAFALIVDTRFPEWYDREYHVRRDLLDERMAEAPDRPLCLVIGSSRLVADFMPERLNNLYDGGRPVTVFNYAHFGAGPRMNLVQVHRVLRDGTRPTHIVLELVPGFLVHDDLPIQQMSLADVPLLWPYSNRTRLTGHMTLQRLNGVHRNRTALLRAVAPNFVTYTDEEKEPALLALGGDDYWARRDEPAEYEQIALTTLAIRRFQSRMNHFQIAPHLAATMNDLIELCRSEGIQVAVVLTPENSQFLSWYRPGAEEELQRYLHKLRTKFDVPIVDARTWIADDDFTDPHHLKTRGAEEFTDRLEQELLRPWLAGVWGEK